MHSLFIPYIYSMNTIIDLELLHIYTYVLYNTLLYFMMS